MSFHLLAMEVKSAPKELFPDGNNTQEGWWIPILIEKYIDPIDHDRTLWNGEIQEVYDGLCKDLEENPEEILEYLRFPDEDVTIQNLEELRDFLKVCLEKGFILNEWS